MIRYLIFVIFGIVLFLLWNRKDGFSIGVPWMIFRPDFQGPEIEVDKGIPFTYGGGVPMYPSFNEAAIAVQQGSNRRNNAIYHIVDGPVEDDYKLDLEGCYSPHNKISGTTLTDSEWDRRNQENKFSNQHA